MAFLDAYDTLEEYTRADVNRQQGAMALVNAYRTWGTWRRIAPMSYTRPPYPLLELSEYGFIEEDLDQIVEMAGSSVLRMARCAISLQSSGKRIAVLWR